MLFTISNIILRVNKKIKNGYNNKINITVSAKALVMHFTITYSLKNYKPCHLTFDCVKKAPLFF